MKPCGPDDQQAEMKRGQETRQHFCTAVTTSAGGIQLTGSCRTSLSKYSDDGLMWVGLTQSRSAWADEAVSVCVWSLRCLECVQKKLQFHWVKLRNEQQQLTVLDVWSATEKKKTKGEMFVNCGNKNMHTHTVLSWSTSFLDQKQAILLPHSMCFVCAAGGSPGLSVSLLFSDWETPHRRPSTFMTWAKFIIKRKVCSITLPWNPLRNQYHGKTMPEIQCDLQTP